MNKRLFCIMLSLVMLICALPAIPAAAAQEDELSSIGISGRSESNPWLVNNWDGLKDSFTTPTDDGETMYIKLSDDITYDGSDTGTLMTSGFDVVLDLGGYTLKCLDRSNASFHLFHGFKGTITIKDSTRYDEQEDRWYTGKIDYLYTLPGRDTSVMSGDIVIKGGTIVNRTHSSSSNLNSVYTSAGNYSGGTYIGTYFGGSLKMYGGTLEADYPVRLGYNPGSGFYGGTLIVKKQVGISIERTDISIYSSENLPYIGEIRIRDASDDTFYYNGKQYNAITPFDIAIPKIYAASHTAAAAAEIFKGRFANGLVSFIDSKRQWKVDEGIIYPESLSTTTPKIWGPIVESSYRLAVPETVSKIELTIPEPEPSDKLIYTASASGPGYDVNRSYHPNSTWVSGVQWTDGNNFASEYEPDTEYQADKKYEVFINVRISDLAKYSFADESSITAKINGKNANIYSDGSGGYIVYRSFDVKKRALDNIAVTVTEPVIGQGAVYSASAPEDADYQIASDYDSLPYENGVSWNSSDGTILADGEKFTKNRKYTVYVIAEVKIFKKYAFEDTDVITVSVNGRTASAVPFGAGRIRIAYEFDLDSIISSVAVEIPEPFAGERIQWAASSPNKAYKIYTSSTGSTYMNGVAWYREGSHITIGAERYFEIGVTYKVVIAVAPSDGYEFADKDNQTFSVNGKAATCSGYTATRRYISYTFTVKNTIDTIDVTIPAPVPGKALSYEPSISSDADYKIGYPTGSMWKNGVMWYIGNTNLKVADNPVAEEGKSYSFRVCLMPKDKENYQFALAKNMKVTVNGHQARAIRQSDHDCHVYYTFSPAVPTTIIDSLELSIPEPTAGNTLSYDAAIVNGEGFVISDVQEDNEIINGVIWADVNNYSIRYNSSTIVEAGERYAVIIMLKIPDKGRYRFGDAETFTAIVNGKTAWPVRISDTEFSVTYTFTAASAGPLLGDVDGDGDVTILDATAIQRVLAGLATAAYNEDVADTDGDGDIAILDVTAIQRWLAGLANNSNIGKPKN